MSCRKQTVKEALAEARRSKGSALSAREAKIVKATAKRAPVLICGPTRRYEGGLAGVCGRGMRCKKVKRGSASFTVCK